MKKVIFLLVLLLLFNCQRPVDKTLRKRHRTQLELHLENSEYFELQKTYYKLCKDLNPIDLLYYEAIIDHIFNRPEESNLAIQQLLTNNTASLNDSMRFKLYQAKLLNHVNLYEYHEAARSSEHIQTHFGKLIDSTDLENLRNELKIWNALKDAPKQHIIKNNNVTIPMMKDKVGLFNIEVDFGATSKNLLFDTGANFSVMIRSLAIELGYDIIEADFYVTAATGLKVQSDIAVAPEIEISGIQVKNVFFLVLDDEDLSFPQIDYSINGAIGYPVIEAMEEIRIRKNKEIFIPKTPVEYSYNNLALDGLMPIIAAKYNEDILRLNFDTGATTTSLYPLFFKDYQKGIEDNYELTNFTAGSGGGVVEFQGYILQDFVLKVADSKATLDSIRLHVKNIGSKESHFHGNFGQDYINQFDEMIISFKYASISFN